MAACIRLILIVVRGKGDLEKRFETLYCPLQEVLKKHHLEICSRPFGDLARTLIGMYLAPVLGANRPKRSSRFATRLRMYRLRRLGQDIEPVFHANLISSSMLFHRASGILTIRYLDTVVDESKKLVLKDGFGSTKCEVGFQYLRMPCSSPQVSTVSSLGAEGLADPRSNGVEYVNLFTENDYNATREEQHQRYRKK
jgi:hypothetical protein